MASISQKRKKLLAANGYVLDPKTRKYVGPDGKTINKDAAQYQLEVWLENTIKEQQGRVIK